MATSDGEGMHNNGTVVDHLNDELYQNDNSQNSDVSQALSLENPQIPNYVSDSGSINTFMGSGMQPRASDLLFVVSMYAEPMKSNIIGHVHSAMDELFKLCHAGKPLWVPQKEERFETLNDTEYMKITKLVEVNDDRNLPSFEANGSDNPSSSATLGGNLQVESSRDMAFIKMSPISIVELLMDLNKWLTAFHKIVSRTTILGSLSEGNEGSYDGKLHVMSAELHLPTLFVGARECYFARYCKQLENDTWGIVDVSLDKYFPYLAGNCRRRPSGCLIKGLPNGQSKVTWVEHVEAEHDKQMSNHIRPLICAGLAFGATRWLTSIVRHLEWSEIMETTVTPLYAEEGVHMAQVGRTSFLKVADRMLRSYCSDISASRAHPWMQIYSGPGSADVRVMVKNNVVDPGKPQATTVVFTTSIWLKVTPSRLFNFLRYKDSRTKWDLLSRNLTIEEFAYMNKGMNPGNRVSLMRAMTREDKIEIFYLQESYTDSICSYVIYAPIDELALSAIANGANPDNVMILPSGFAILSAGFPDDDNDVGGETGGSLLTVAFHVIENLDITTSVPPESAVIMHKTITDTVTNIKDAVMYNNLVNNWEQD